MVVAVAVATALVRTYRPEPQPEPTAKPKNLVQTGARVFDRTCAQCHYTDKTETKIGPGLEGLFEKDKLPASGRDVSAENVRNQLRNPYQNMPSFPELEQDKGDAIVAYLKTL